jgi:ABC-type dipeptide/oligopeptide/nickel transport system ATPase component
MSDDLLRIQNLTVRFTLGQYQFNAADGVNLNVGNNEVVVLAGESGSGKTITALAVTGIILNNAKVINGKIIFFGQDLLNLKETELTKIRGRQIAYIFQEPTSFLNPVYTVGSQIMEAVSLHQDKTQTESKAAVMELLDLVKIKDPERVFGDYPHQLSGGMNQRVFIAMALACNPRLIIADEPTTALDVTIESQILYLLCELKQKLGFSLLFITHNLSIAKRIADRICIMHRGKVVESGTVEKIFNTPEHFHTKELVKAYEIIGKL